MKEMAKVDEHNKRGNCFDPAVVYEKTATGIKSIADVCTEHDEPRGECPECPQCPACKAASKEQRRRIAELEAQLEAARDDVARMEEQVANYRFVGTMPMGEAIDIIINAKK